MKKIALLLLLCFCIPFFSACQNNSATPDTTQEDTEEPKKDLGGIEFVWRQTYPKENIFGFTENSVFADSATVRKNDIETALNCKITIENTEWSQIPSLLMAATATADHFADVINAADETQKNLMKGDLLVPLDDVVEFLNYKDSQKWGTPGMLETVMWDSKVYGVRASLWPERYPAFYTPIIFNQTLTASFNHPDPREYVEKGEWTRDKFIQLLQDCTVNDGENRIYGLSTFPNFIFAMAVRANGGQSVRKEGDKYVNDMGSPENIDAIQWGMDLITNNKDSFLFGTGWTGIMDPFLKGEAAMLMYPTWGLFSSVGMKLESWGLLPFPNGPGREYGDWAAYYDGNDFFMSIPRNSEYPEDVAYMLNELCEPLDDYPTYEDLMTYYERNLFHDKRDFDLYFKMAENCRYSYWFEGGNPVLGALGSSTFTKTPAQIVESTDTAFQTIIDKYIAGNQVYFEDIENAEGMRDIGE